MVAVPVPLLLFTSVAVKVTVTGVPTLAQVKVFGDKLTLASPHASELPLFTSRPLNVAVPAAFK
jgi:hypothetical protein